jgi:hypothetical protein
MAAMRIMRQSRRSTGTPCGDVMSVRIVQIPRLVAKMTIGAKERLERPVVTVTVAGSTAFFLVQCADRADHLIGEDDGDRGEARARAPHNRETIAGSRLGWGCYYPLYTVSGECRRMSWNAAKMMFQAREADSSA